MDLVGSLGQLDVRSPGIGEKDAAPVAPEGKIRLGIAAEEIERLLRQLRGQARGRTSQ